MNENGWSRYEELVMYRLERLEETLKELAEAQSKTHTSVVKLQVKSSFWGAISGAVSGVITAVVAAFTTHR